MRSSQREQTGSLNPGQANVGNSDQQTREPELQVLWFVHFLLLLTFYPDLATAHLSLIDEIDIYILFSLLDHV